MGDSTTHVILYGSYWYLVREENGMWVDTQVHQILCKVGEEQKKLDLKEVK